MKSIKHLLVIRLSALGDICMTLPVIDSVCRSYLNIEFTLLTSKVGAIVADSVLSHPNLKVIGINKKDYNGLIGLNRLYNELKPYHFDAVADLHDVLRSKWVDFRFKLAGKSVVKINKGRDEKKSLVAHTIHRQLTNSIDRYRDVFVRLGLNVEVDYNGFEHGQVLLKKASPAGSSFAPEFSIGIAPFAQHSGKVYPSTLMRQVIDDLVRKFPQLKIYLFGGKDEKGELDNWSVSHPNNIFNLAGIQSISDDLLRMSRMKLMISMDSANMHLASLVGLRCVSIWGATHPFAGFLGYGQSEGDCISLPLDCRPCSIYGNIPCKRGDFQCMHGIKPETIVARIESILNDNL